MSKTILPERLEVGPGEYLTWFEWPDRRWVRFAKWLEWKVPLAIRRRVRWPRGRWWVTVTYADGHARTGFFSRRDALLFAAGRSHGDGDVIVERVDGRGGSTTGRQT